MKRLVSITLFVALLISGQGYCLPLPPSVLHIYVKASTDSRLFYGYDFPNLFSGWEQYGSSTHEPSMATYNGKLYVAVKSSGGNNIYISSTTGDGIWTSWTPIPGQTDKSPMLISFNGYLFLFVHGLNNSIYYKKMNSNGVWSQWDMVPGWSSSDRPTATVLGNTLWLFAKGAGANNTVYYRGLSNTGVWSTTRALPGATNVAPAVTAYQPDTETAPGVWVFVRGTNGTIYYTYSYSIEDTDPGWSTWQSLPGSTLNTPALAVHTVDNDLYLVVRGGDSGIYYAKYCDHKIPKPGGGYIIVMTWDLWYSIPGTTSHTPASAFY
ncbi:MAG: hypothetical protein QW203_05945 [Thermoplasmatales archaeon]